NINNKNNKSKVTFIEVEIAFEATQHPPLNHRTYYLYLRVIIDISLTDDL
ncbi:hypothetical protein TSAR_015969, partial [Trichomalopsis sarcophagae]